MTIFQSDAIKGIVPTPYPAFAGVAVTTRFTITVPATAAANDILEAVIIPAGTRPADIFIDADDVDGGAGITFDLGVMSGAVGSKDPARTCGAEFFAASALGQTGGVAHPTLVSAYRVAASNVERSIGIKIKTAAATPQAGVIGITLTVVA